jgi:hypothetical protein
MQKTVYYLVHEPSAKRIRYYTTQGGARIAARSRNKHLGFYTRIDKLYSLDGHTEFELYCIDDCIVKGSYCIVEDYIEMENLYE